MSLVTYQVEFQNRKADIDSLLKKNPHNRELMHLANQCNFMLKRAQVHDNLFDTKLQEFDRIISQHEEIPTTTLPPSSQPIPIPQISTKSNQTPF